jgi:hypothetical protein
VTTGDRSAVEGTGTLGTFGGVFTPRILTILGLVLFLRVHLAISVSIAAEAATGHRSTTE